MEEGSSGFLVERRGCGSKGSPPKLDKQVEEELIAEVQRLQAENAYPKNLQALVYSVAALVNNLPIIWSLQNSRRE